MEAEKVIDSVKDWLNKRLKNPYFASVIAVWLFTNRIEVFGLFNFKDDQSVQERLLWMQERFHNKQVFGIHMGFEGVILFSLVIGLVTMLGFKYAQAISEVIYDKLGQYAVAIRVWNIPLKWVSLEKFEEMFNQFEEEKNKLGRRNLDIESELITLKKEKETALLKIQELNGDKFKLEHEKRDLTSDSNLLAKLKEDNSIYLNGIEELKSDKAQIKAENEALMASNVTLGAALKKNKEDEDWNEKDKIQKEKFLQIFLESPFLEYFDEIMGFIRNHKIINDSVPTPIIEYYVANKLIVMNGNLYVMTEKGNEYYISYLKTKKHNISIPPESNFKGVKGGVR